MLASTVQFSTNKRPPSPRLRRPRPHQGNERSGNRMAPRRDTGPAPRNRGAGPLPQDPTACLPPPAATGSVPHPRTPRREPAGRTGSRPAPAAELVSVPPSSTTRTPRGGSQNRSTVTGPAWPLTPGTRPGGEALLRKEVIQPHLPVRLPCYDFVPIADPAFDGSLPARGWATGF